MLQRCSREGNWKPCIPFSPSLLLETLFVLCRVFVKGHNSVYRSFYWIHLLIRLLKLLRFVTFQKEILFFAKFPIFFICIYVNGLTRLFEKFIQRVYLVYL